MATSGGVGRSEEQTSGISGSSRPTLKKLQNTRVIFNASSRWYQLGIQLLDDDQVAQLDIIKKNNDDVTERCTALFRYWLRMYPSASWHELVAAMRAPGVELNKLAAAVEESYTGQSTGQSGETFTQPSDQAKKDDKTLTTDKHGVSIPSDSEDSSGEADYYTPDEDISDNDKDADKVDGNAMPSHHRHQSAGYRVFCDYYNKIMESVDARSLSHYFVSAKLLELENHEKITEPTLSKQQANALLFSKVKDSLEQEGNAELLTEALKVMGDYGDGATKRLSRTIIKTALSEVESNQQGKPLESTVVQLENGSSTQLHSVFVNYYSKLVDHFNEDLLLYCVKPEIILPNDVLEIQQCTCNRRAATLLLKKIDGPLRGGDSKNLYEYLKVLEENGTVDIQSLSREIMKQLEEVH